MGEGLRNYCCRGVVSADALNRTAVTLLLFTALPALAGGWTLSWTRAPGAESCADGPALERAVEDKLGRGVFTEAAQPD